MTFGDNCLGGIRLFTVLRLDETKGFSHFSDFPLFDKDLFQDAVKRAGDFDASFVTLDFAEDIERLDRFLGLDAPTTRDKRG